MTKSFSLEADGISYGPILVRLAKTPEEIEAAKKLRYQVFYEEYGAIPDENTLKTGLDSDFFDSIADHLIVIDTRIDHLPSRIVGTYRLLQQPIANAHNGFYTKDEYDISNLENTCVKMLELGRSCTHAEYRTRPVMQLLWQAIAEYIDHHNNDLLFGCASFHGTNVEDIAEELSYLYHYHRAPDEFCSQALPHLAVDMDMIAKNEIDERRVFKKLPSLIKGYLRLGGFIGNGAVIDHQFNTIDVCIIVKTGLMSSRYKKHYERRAQSANDTSVATHA